MSGGRFLPGGCALSTPWRRRRASTSLATSRGDIPGAIFSTSRSLRPSTLMGIRVARPAARPAPVHVAVVVAATRGIEPDGDQKADEQGGAEQGIHQPLGVHPHQLGVDPLGPRVGLDEIEMPQKKVETTA